MFKDYCHECEVQNKKVYGYGKYASKIRDMNIGFVKLGIKECEVCGTQDPRESRE